MVPEGGRETVCVRKLGIVGPERRAIPLVPDAAQHAAEPETERVLLERLAVPVDRRVGAGPDERFRARTARQRQMLVEGIADQRRERPGGPLDPVAPAVPQETHEPGREERQAAPVDVQRRVPAEDVARQLAGQPRDRNRDDRARGQHAGIARRRLGAVAGADPVDQGDVVPVAGAATPPPRRPRSRRRLRRYASAHPPGRAGPAMLPAGRGHAESLNRGLVSGRGSAQPAAVSRNEAALFVRGRIPAILRASARRFRPFRRFSSALPFHIRPSLLPIRQRVGCISEECHEPDLSEPCGRRWPVSRPRGRGGRHGVERLVVGEAARLHRARGEAGRSGQRENGRQVQAQPLLWRPFQEPGEPRRHFHRGLRNGPVLRRLPLRQESLDHGPGASVPRRVLARAGGGGLARRLPASRGRRGPRPVGTPPS